MPQAPERQTRRSALNLRSKGQWILNTVHNLVILFAAGLVMSATGWLLEGYLGVNPVAPTPLIVVIPSVIVGFGGVYGAVALWSYANSQPEPATQAA